MTDLQALIRAIDDLTPEEFETLYDYVSQRHHKERWWVVPPDHLEQLEQVTQPLQQDAASMTEDAINELIDEALGEVRVERKQRSGRH